MAGSASSAGSAADARAGAPAVTGVDSQQLLHATVKKKRFLTAMDAACEASSISGTAAQAMHVRVELAGGDGQNGASVPADAAFTDVFFELRVSPAPSPFSFVLSQGELMPSMEPPGGFTGGNGTGFAVRASSSGGG
eukprot:7383985-Prymnesium_polylepis.1